MRLSWLADTLNQNTYGSYQSAVNAQGLLQSGLSHELSVAQQQRQTDLLGVVSSVQNTSSTDQATELALRTVELDIKLNHLPNYSLTTGDQALLTSLSETCFRDGGLVVAWALSLRSKYQGFPAEVYDCAPTQGLIAAPSIDKQIGCKVMPNPSNGNVIVSWQTKVDQLVVVNTLGQRVNTFTVNPDRKRMELQLQLQPGLYSIQLIHQGKLMNVEQVVIID